MVRYKVMLRYYYIIISIVFFSGWVYISTAYDMVRGPVAPGAFQTLFNWVSTFAYFYIVPLVFVGLLIMIRSYRRKGLSRFLITLLSILYIFIASLVGYVLMFVFVMMFYGFAP